MTTDFWILLPWYINQHRCRVGAAGIRPNPLHSQHHSGECWVLRAVAPGGSVGRAWWLLREGFSTSRNSAPLWVAAGPGVRGPWLGIPLPLWAAGPWEEVPATGPLPELDGDRTSLLTGGTQLPSNSIHGFFFWAK